MSKQEKEWGILVLPILRIRVAESRYRVADACVVQRSSPFENILTIAPLLCVEVLSPDDRMSAMIEKINDYLAMCVEIVWLIDPWRRKAFVVDALGYRRAEELPVPGTDIRLQVGELFAELR